MLASDGSVPLKGNLVPDQPNLRDLGSETLGLRNVYVDGLVDGVDVSEHVINPDVHHKRLDIKKAGVLIGTRQTLNFIDSTTVEFRVLDDPDLEEVKIQGLSYVPHQQEGVRVTERRAINWSKKFIIKDDPAYDRVNVDFSLVEPCDWVDFQLTASGTIISAPTTGYKIRLLAFYWSSDADIVTALRWGATGSNMFALPMKGITGMNLIGRERDAPEATELYGYLSGAGTMRGSIGYKIVAV